MSIRIVTFPFFLPFADLVASYPVSDVVFTFFGFNVVFRLGPALA